jgi:hypothetical protein
MPSVPSASLNFKAYEQDVPKYPTINQPQGTTFGQKQDKETVKHNPVFNTPGAISATGNQQANNLQVSNVK